MAVKYHYHLRQQLNTLLNDNDTNLVSRGSKAQSLLTKYQSNPEESLAAQVQFYQNLIDKLSQYHNQAIYQKKTWWQTFLYFIGFLNQDESGYLAVIKQAKQQLKNAQREQNPLAWYDKVLWYFVGGAVGMVLQDKDTKRTLSYLSHRTLLMVKNVPDELEGSLTIDSFDNYRQDLEAFLETLPHSAMMEKRFRHIIDQLQHCHQVEESVLMKKAQHKFLQKLGRTYDIESICLTDRVFDALDTIVNLEAGETALFNHGFHSEEGAHATVFDVEKVSTDSVRFRFYNTGAGAHNTASWKTLFVNLVIDDSQTPIKVTDELSIQSLFKSDFIETLVRPTIIQAETVSDGVNLMNAPILKLYHAKQLHDDKKKLNYQFMGSCGQSCIDAWIENQLPESEFIQFYCYRLQLAINKIGELLEDESLTEEQKQYCRCMRKAAQVEIAFLSKKLDGVSEQLNLEIKKTYTRLQDVRRENALSKGKDPKTLTYNYCQEKLAKDRLSRKFDSQQQKEIQQVNQASDIKIHVREKEGVSLGSLFSGAKYIPLPSSQLNQNKLAKAKLCQKITALQQQVTRCQNLLFFSQKAVGVELNKGQFDTLVDKRMRNQALNYSDLKLAPQ
jgi:hypothetical protein